MLIDLLQSKSRAISAAAILMLALATPGRAYDIRQTSVNNTGARQYGQKLALYGGQTILAKSSNTFPRIVSQVGSSTTTLSFGFTTSSGGVAVGRSADIFVRTGGNSALVRSFTWTDQAGNSTARVQAVSGQLVAGPSEEDPQGNPLVTLLWTFYNGTDEEISIPGIGFFFDERPPGAPAAAPRFPYDVLRAAGGNGDIVTGGDFAGFFGGAEVRVENGSQLLFLPPGGGVTFRVDPHAPAQDPTLDLIAVAAGVIASDGNGRAVLFNHQALAPRCPAAAGSRPRDSRHWRSQVRAYLAAGEGEPTPEKEKIRAAGDVVIGPAQVFLDQLKEAVPGLHTMSLTEILSRSPRTRGVQVRSELVSLMLNLASAGLCPDDCVRVDGEEVPLAGVAPRMAQRIASGRPRAVRQALALLRGINRGQIPIIPCHHQTRLR